jgi:hypothetical protein
MFCLIQIKPLLFILKLSNFAASSLCLTAPASDKFIFNDAKPY